MIAETSIKAEIDANVFGQRVESYSEKFGFHSKSVVLIIAPLL
jgi:hypothetical protein